MPGALVVDAGAVTMALAAAKAKVDAGSDSTFTVRNSPFASAIALTDLWRKGVAAGEAQITSPKIVPVSNGIDIKTPAGLADFLLPGPPLQALTPQDELTVQDLGGNEDTDVVALQSYYDDLPGASPTLKMPGDVAGATKYVFGWPVDATASATAGDQASTAITETMDSSTANLWYALLGYVVDAEVAAVGLKGVDTSQLFVAGPGDTEPWRTRSYFADLSLSLGKPCIPLFNAANKSNTNIVLVDNAASTKVNVTMILAELAATYQP